MDPSDRASTLLDELKLKGTSPVPLQNIIDHLGYKAQLFPASEKTRNIACGLNRDTKTIMANAADAPTEQRYAFAHVIGHVLLQSEGNVVDTKSNLHHENKDPTELEANRFADELLMETMLFLEKWDQLGGDRSKLANLFGVSKERIQIRATLLGIA